MMPTPDDQSQTSFYCDTDSDGSRWVGVHNDSGLTEQDLEDFAAVKEAQRNQAEEEDDD